MKIYLSHSKELNFVEDLYQPLRNSKLNAEHDIFLPYEGKFQDTKELVKNCDLFIADVSLPSTGMGMEIAWADFAKRPIIFMYRQGSRYSNSLQFISKHFIEYTSAEDMLEKLTREIGLITRS